MTVNLHDPINHNGLFDELGHLFNAESVLDTARGTTVPNGTLNVITGWKAMASDPTISGLIAPLGPAQTTWQGAGAGYFAACQTAGQQLLINMVNNDTPLSPANLTNAVAELIEQMQANSQSVKACTVGNTVTATSGNSGDGVLIVSSKDGSGLKTEYQAAETLLATATSNGTTPPIQFVGDPSANVNSQTWPSGSGAKISVSAVDAAAGNQLVANGGFETSTALANAPDSWVISVGTPGSTIKLPAPEVQQVAVSGSPTSGAYFLGFTDKNGHVEWTTAISFGANGTTVQTALRSLNFLAQVTVSTTGNGPNFTHTITFIGYGGALTLLTVNNQTNGTITPSRVSAGTGLVFQGGGSLWMPSDGVTLPAINSLLSGLQPLTPYAVSMWAAVDFTPVVTGVATVELINGIGGSVINNAQGSPNSFTFPVTSLGATFQHIKGISSVEPVFHTPAVLPPLVYLRIRVSTAIDSGKSLFLDQVAMTAMTRLYAGGPFAAAFRGSNSFQAGDSWTVATTNDFGGRLQTFSNRNLGLASLGAILPSNSSGGESIPDSLIS